MSRFQTERPAEVASARWAEQAEAGAARIPLDMRPTALAVKRFPLRMNHYERELLRMAADLDNYSMHTQLRIALRAYCERKLRAAKVPLPR